MKSIPVLLLLSILCSQHIHAQQGPPCSSFCVTGMYMDSLTPGQLWVSIAFTADSTVFINYPYIPSIIDAQGDTIATGSLWFFGQFGGSTADYPVATDLTELPDNLEATVNFSYDTVTCQLVFPCITALSDDDVQHRDLILAPNPFSHSTCLYSTNPLLHADVLVYSTEGGLIHRIPSVTGTSIPLSFPALQQGLYILQIREAKRVHAIPFLIISH